ncbi:MAG TPA: DeoR family transcriptional regulator [Ignavibacteria bacterium]|nr:DeoR family transcriptional regulator [Ignavibacteria bacterium]
MSISEISNAHLKTINSSWDFYPDPVHSINNLSEEKIYGFIEQIGIDIDLLAFLNKFELIKNDKITFGVFLLFTDSEPLLSTIEVGRFSSETIIKDSLTVRTDLISEVEIVLEFIRKHLSKGYIITGKAKREERWEYPLEALREIVINMVVHRDYRSSNDSVIKIFNDRIEFFNPGGLVDNLTIEQVMSGKYRSHIRNKQIANIFKEAGIIEKYGSGIKRVIETFKGFGLKVPTFDSIEGGFLVTVYNNDTDKRLDKILFALKKNNKISTIKLAEMNSVSKSTILRDLRVLKKKGLLKRVGSEKSGYWQILE